MAEKYCFENVYISLKNHKLNFCVDRVKQIESPKCSEVTSAKSLIVHVAPA